MRVLIFEERFLRLHSECLRRFVVSHPNPSLESLRCSVAVVNRLEWATVGRAIPIALGLPRATHGASFERCSRGREMFVVQHTRVHDAELRLSSLARRVDRT